MAISIWQRLNRWTQRATPNPRKTSVNEPSRSYVPCPSAKRRFILPDAFNPDREMIPTPGLSKKIEELQRAGRYRTAIEEILKVLDRDPGNQQALFLAANILSLPHTEQLTAAEPLSDAQTFDRRLNPIWAMCHECYRGWVPNSIHLSSFFGKGRLSVMNPIGEQCPKCGYTLCHECLKRKPIGPGYAFYEHECPPGCGVKLSTPVHPTGRRNLQFGRRPQGVTHVFVFREGPIKPDTSYVRALLETRSPDVFASRPQIFAVPVGQWPDDPDFYAMAFLLEQGVTKEMIQSWETGTITDDNSTRVHVVKIYASS